MPKKKSSPKTALATKSITNVKLLVAAIALFVAGGLAFAALPTSQQSSVIRLDLQCGTLKLYTPCGDKFSQKKYGPMHSAMRVQCGNGEIYSFGDTCNSDADWIKKAESVCENRCSNEQDIALPSFSNVNTGAVSTCIDNDNGLNYGVPSEARQNNGNGSTITQRDTCVYRADGTTLNHILEGYCNPDGQVRGFPNNDCSTCLLAANGNAYCADQASTTTSTTETI